MVTHVVRVGSAVLAVTEYAEFSPADISQAVTALAHDDLPVVKAMTVYSD